MVKRGATRQIPVSLGQTTGKASIRTRTASETWGTRGFGTIIPQRTMPPPVPLFPAQETPISDLVFPSALPCHRASSPGVLCTLQDGFSAPLIA